MNTVKITVLVAMMVGVALCGTCSNICNTPCNVAFQTCQFIASGNDLCTANKNVCNGACAAVCACDDQCESQCKPALDSCLSENANNIIGLGQCDIQAGFCLSGCQAQCVTNSVVGILGGGGRR